MEFFCFNQGANGPITIEEIAAALERAGLVAAGTHTGGLQQMVDPAYRQTQIEMARMLGYRMIGTAGNPANPPQSTLAAWQGYAEQANTVGAALRAVGIRYFFHPEQDWFRHNAYAEWYGNTIRIPDSPAAEHHRAIYRDAVMLAGDVIAAWQELYPALALPQAAMLTLQ